MNKYFLIFLGLGLISLGFIFGIQFNIFQNTDDITWEVIIASCSLFIAVLAYFHTIFQSNETIKFNKSSIRPHLIFWTSENFDDLIFTLTIRNNGAGPALIKRFDYFVNNKRIEGKGTDVVDNLLKEIISDYEYKKWPAFIGPEYVMKVNDEIDLITIQFNPDNPPTKEYMDKASEKVEILVEYESVYGEFLSLDTKKMKEKHNL